MQEVRGSIPLTSKSQFTGKVGKAARMDISNLDPDLAALLEDIPVAPTAPSLDLFADLGDDILLQTNTENIDNVERDASRVDLTIKSFPKIEKFYNDSPHKYFDSADFYKRVLKNGGESAQR